MEAHAKISIRKARILMDQKRYRQAESFLREALAAEPRHNEALSLLVNVLTNQHRDDEALAQSEELLSLSPTEAHNFCQHGHILIKLLHLGKAEEFIREAIRLNPNQADYYCLLALVYTAAQKDEKERLHFANQGLAITPDHEGCLRVRIQCLSMLKRKLEMNHAIQIALNRYPESAYVHATVGWTMLDQRNHRAAIHHFSEASRIDPLYKSAQDGLKAVLKGRLTSIILPLLIVTVVLFWQMRTWLTVMNPSVISIILIVLVTILSYNVKIVFTKWPR